MRLWVLALLYITGAAAAQTQWHDPSPHAERFVEVEKDVRLEVLDWGGSGRAIILLPGSGNTAHIFDDFAPKLNRFGHVYGITRRGFGRSSHPETGYSEQRLADDVLSVMAQLKIDRPVLVGHSMSGEELTRIGDEHSDRVSGLVYLAAIADPTDFPANSKEYMELASKLPAPMRSGPQATAADRSSLAAADDLMERRMHVRFPLAEIYNSNIIGADGSVQEYPDQARVHILIGKGAMQRDYSRIAVPILAFVDLDCPVEPQADVTCLPNNRVDYEPANNQERQTINAFWAATDLYISRWMDKVRQAHSQVRFIDLPRANHYVFLSNTSEVLGKLESFMRGM